MSLPDFNCSIEDNHSILVVVHLLHPPAVPPEVVKPVLDAVTRFRHLSLENTPREISFRYQIRFNAVKPERSDFQVHRQVLGLICINIQEYAGDIEAQKRENLIQFNGFQSHYGDKVLESRCLVFRKAGNSNGVRRSENGKENVSVIDGACLSRDSKTRLSTGGNALLNGFGHDILKPVHKSFSENNLSQQQGAPTGNAPVKSGKSYVEIPLDDAVSTALGSIMEEYLLALFSALEAARPSAAPDKVDKDWKGSNPSLDKPESAKKDGFRFDLGSSQKKRQLGWKRKNFAEWLLLAGLPYHAVQHFAQAVEMLQSAKDQAHLAAALEGWAAASWNVLPASDPHLALRLSSLDNPEQRLVLTKIKAASLNGHLVNAFNVHLSDAQKDKKLCLPVENIYEKLKTAAQNYGIEEMGRYEMEVSLKMARLFIFLGEKIKAHKGLRQAIFVRLEGVNETTERIERFLTIGELYEILGFHRQAALFRLLAADRYLSPPVSQQGMMQAFRLTVRSLPTYGLALSALPLMASGWPELQAQVYQKLAATCRSQPEVYKRVLLILLENFCDVLSVIEKEEIVKNLSFMIQESGPPSGKVVTEGGELDVVSLTKVPFVTEFIVSAPPRHLQPLLRVRYQGAQSGLFIHKAFKSRNDTVVPTDEAKFMWVANERSTISLQLSNKLPKEIRVENLSILTENLQYDTAPASLVLPALTNRSFPVMIAGIPLEPGLLGITGYSFSVFGVKTQCSIVDLGQLQRNAPPKSVRIAPALPQLRVETSCPPSDSFIESRDEPVVATASILIFNGQRTSCTITVQNVGKIPLETLSVMVNAADPGDDILAQRCISHDPEAISSFLPLQPGASARFELDIWAAFSFITQFRDPASMPDRSFPGSDRSFQEKNFFLQFFLKLDYSGGPGMIQDYYRQSSIAFFLDVLPSVGITQWNTLFADEPDEFYFVVDFQNQTDDEIEVLYPPGKKMLVVGHDHARVPALASKVPLLDIHQSNAQEICREHLSKSVDLRWKFVDKDIMGKCWTGDVTWNAEHIETISLPPLSVSFFRDGTPIRLSRTEGCSVRMAEVVSLEVQFTNRFASTVSRFEASVELREEREMPNADAAVGSVALIGGTTGAVLDFEPNETHALTFQALMLIPGVFHFDVFFEYAHRRWKSGEFCRVVVAALEIQE